MPKPMLIAVCAGLLSLLAVLPAFQGAPGGLMLFYVASLPIYLAGFAYGTAAGTVATLSGFLAATVFGGFLLAGVFALVHLLPAWAVVRQATRKRFGPDGQDQWMPAGPILGSLSGLSAGILLAAGAALANGPGVAAVTTDALTKAFDLIAPHLPETAREAAVAMYAPYVPSSIGAVWLITSVVSAMTAQGLLVRFGRNLRPTPDYRDLRLPEWHSWLFAAAVIAAVIAAGDVQYLARNMALLLAVPFSLVGVSLIHLWVARRRHKVPTLILFYFLFFIAAWVVFVMTAALGALEQWAGIRHRLTGPADLNE